MKNKTLGIAGALVSALLILFLQSCAGGEAGTGQEMNGGVTLALPVDAIVAGSEPVVQELQLTGSVLPEKEVVIVSELPKKVLAVNFKDGEEVSKGQILYKLEDDDLKARLKELEVEIRLLRLTSDRVSALAASGAVKVQELDETSTRLAAAEARYELTLSELGKTEIKAPFSGRIGISRVFAGAYVSPGTPLVSLHDLSYVKLEFYVPEKNIFMIKPGTAVSFVTENSASPLNALITAVEPHFEPSSRSIRVQAKCVNEGSKLMGGMTAKVRLSVTGEKGIFLPSESLIAGENGYAVYLVKGGLATLQAVQVGQRSESRAGIVSGIAEGDTVVVSNILRTAPGTSVHPVINQL